MCGVAGIVCLDGGRPDAHLLAAMRDALAHRGPDAEGLYLADGVGLAHRRLAILDLSSAGRCPMADASGEVLITYNGEVYNYRELVPDLAARGLAPRSATDTEVVLNGYLAYDTDCFARFNGMWACAIWDSRKRRLVCARDRFGVKPFYYTWNGRELRFASEIKALLVDRSFPRRVNHARLADFLFNGVLDHTDETLFEGVYQLPPAHYLVLDARGLVVRPFWTLRCDPGAVPAGPEQQAERFRELFHDAVRLRLRSDVRVGTCLSGGLDSSAIVCVANELLRQGQGASLGDHQQTFTACFDDPAVDERRYVRAVLERTGARGHQVFPTSEDVADHLPKMLYHQDEPFPSPSACAQYLVMKCAREAAVKVLLDGQGADEILAGYEPHLFPHLLDAAAGGRWRSLGAELGVAYRFLRVGFFNRPLSESLPEPLYRAMWVRARPRVFPGLVCTAGGVAPERPPVAVAPSLRGASRLGKTLFRDVAGIRLPLLLHLEDRNSMAHGIEARTPFLDYRLVEYAFALPNVQKRHLGETKVVLRRALAGTLPELVARRRDKIGFATPTSLLVEGRLKERVADVIFSSSFAERPFFDAAEARAAWSGFGAGRTRIARAVWQWLVVEEWLRLFEVST